ncbi:glycosyltransferase family 2 protein [Selenomonas sputigena]|uniref:glycosyltransferase family 2 protein n=1 Tax=Selenomonas sputigena TaxID=69823 RepID=UPI0028E56FD7|nr:glycosyltransferase family 2 protein [Selenomonas sputigena]
MKGNLLAQVPVLQVFVSLVHENGGEMTLNRIVVVSMVRNEEDIIESFVRWHCAIADAVIVLDHRSTDRTKEILCALRDEGLPLILTEAEDMAYRQWEYTTELVVRAFREFSADVVCPLDADEFLLADTEDVFHCRRILQNLELGVYYSLAWIDHFLTSPEEDRDMFLLARDHVRERSPKIESKVLLTRKEEDLPLWLNGRMSVAQGNHFVVIHENSRAVSCPTKEATGLYLAHFPERSIEQILSKNIVGWLTNAAKFSCGTVKASHWRHVFQAYLAHERIEMAAAREPLPSWQDAFRGRFPLRFTREEVPEHKLLRNIMLTAEGIADAHAQREATFRMVEKGGRKCIESPVVSVLIPFYGDMQELRLSLRDLALQQYPFYECILLCFSPVEKRNLRILAKEEGVSHPILLARDEVQHLPQHVRSAYVQYFLPGISHNSACLQQMVASLALNDEISFVMADVEVPEQDAPGPLVYLDFAAYELPFYTFESNELRKTILKLGKFPAGGMSEGLFRRETMESCGYLLKELQDVRLQRLSLWLSILEKTSSVGFFQKTSVQVRRRLSAEEKLLCHMEWLLLLEQEIQARKLGLSLEELKVAVTLAIDGNCDGIMAVRFDVSSGLYEACRRLRSELAQQVCCLEHGAR